MKEDDFDNKVIIIIQRITPPVFPDFELRVTDAGPLGLIDSKNVIQETIDKCYNLGGGIVVIPEGKYKINWPLKLRSNVNLHLAKNSYLKFSSSPNDYLPVVRVGWEETACYNYSPMIYGYQQKSITITGEGTIDGSADEFWMQWKLLQEPEKVYCEI